MVRGMSQEMWRWDVVDYYDREEYWGFLSHCLHRNWSNHSRRKERKRWRRTWRKIKRKIERNKERNEDSKKRSEEEESRLELMNAVRWVPYFLTESLPTDLTEDTILLPYGLFVLHDLTFNDRILSFVKRPTHATHRHKEDQGVYRGKYELISCYFYRLTTPLSCMSHSVKN